MYYCEKGDNLMNKYQASKVDDPKISVIIAAFNEEYCISDCLISLQRQTWQSLEIIVIDDGSTDRTVEICLEHNVKVLKQNHKGPGAARNLGAQAAGGNILVIADADMTFDEKYVETLVEPIVKGEVIATIGWDEYVSNWDNPWARCQCWYSGLPEKRRLPLEAPDGSDVYRAVRRDFFMKVGGFEGGRSGDDKTIYLRTGLKAHIVKRAVCYHNNAESLSEIFRDAAWKGRDVVGRNEVRWYKIIFDNPLRAIAKGIIRGINRREFLLPFYALVYNFGFHYGLFHALITKKYQK